MIQINNKRDYLRFYWFFLLVMLLFATALMLSILRMSWLALFIYLILHYFFQKAFQLKMYLNKKQLTISKTFVGLPYWQKRAELSQAVRENATARWILQQKNGQKFELMEDVLTHHGGLRFFDGKKSIIIADREAAQLLLKSLEQMLKQSELKVYYIQ